MAKLIILQGDSHRIFDLKENPVTIGRAPDNVLWLDDPSLSRRHCELRRTNGAWWLHDKGSFNGTFCNNLSCQSKAMVAGDKIQLGTTVCYFIPGDEEGAAGAAGGAPKDPAEAASREATSRKLRNFMALLEITKAVSSELSQKNLLTLIVQKSIELIKADRGFAIRKIGEELKFEVALKADGKVIDNPEKQISNTVVASVTKTGEPVITINAQNDLGSFMSIVALEVRSLICVPLRVKDKILGALYVDSHISEQEFGEESLNLLQAFADQAAIALENALLYDEVVESREQEKRIRRIFQKYVPAEVVNAVLNVTEGTRLSEKLVATVLFSDIRSFTSISERLQPEEVVHFLNDYLQRMVDIVFEHQGIVDKFVGDAVMAVWGAPVPKPDDAARAVQAAIKMLEEVENFNREQRQRGGVEIEIGIGLHTGPLIAGNMGSDKKMEYTVIGDTVNVASRVESLNKNMCTKLLITEDTKKAAETAGGRFEFKPMPPVPVKGKSEKLIVFEVPVPKKPGQETLRMPHDMPTEAGGSTGRTLPAYAGAQAALKDVPLPEFKPVAPPTPPPGGGMPPPPVYGVPGQPLPALPPAPGLPTTQMMKRIPLPPMPGAPGAPGAPVPPQFAQAGGTRPTPAPARPAGDGSKPKAGDEFFDITV